MIRVDFELSSPFPSGLAKVELRHQEHSQGSAALPGTHEAGFHYLFFWRELQGSNLVFPMPMMLVSAFIRYVKP